MEKDAASDRLFSKLDGGYCSHNILVVPPCFHPHEHITGTSDASTTDPARFPIHPGGIIVPLQPSLRRQLSEVARYFTFPSTEGLSLHVDIKVHGSMQSSREAGEYTPQIGDLPLPMVSAASWESLLFGCKEHAVLSKHQAPWMGPCTASALGVVAKLQISINYHRATWYEAWLTSKFYHGVPIHSLGVSRRRSETDSLFSSRRSQSTAPTSSNASPVPLAPIRIASTPDELQPLPVSPDESTRAIRSRSIYLLSQTRQYRWYDQPESREDCNSTVLPVCSYRKETQDIGILTTPPSSQSPSISNTSHHESLSPGIDLNKTDPESPKEMRPLNTVPKGKKKSEDLDFVPGVIETEVNMASQFNSSDTHCVQPEIIESYFQCQIVDPKESRTEERSSSDKNSIDLEKISRISTETVWGSMPEKRSSELELVSDWKKFLAQMSPPSVGISGRTDLNNPGFKLMRNRNRRVPHRLNLLQVDTSDPLPIVSPTLSISSPTGTTHKIQKNLDLELETIREEHRNSHVLAEDATSSSPPRSPRALMNTLQPSAIRNLADRAKKPWARSRLSENIRSDSVKRKSNVQNDTLSKSRGSFSVNETSSISKCFSFLGQTSRDIPSSSDSRPVNGRSSPSFDSPSGTTVPRRDQMPGRVLGQSKKSGSESKRASKLSDPDSPQVYRSHQRTPNQSFIRLRKLEL
ncbi:hypothetical protein PCANC_15642 [Puccinia coronata f. sp. avenae]|uniref:Uncharacterized protein n=1 Tax=Puccinia coronata f. sp. avenae TaxID=200324 RepID=A0A2N5UPK6_9BASI|nr:hypothetical protein PCANC_15642 [Puccinia coronata f. sp. avenae]